MPQTARLWPVLASLVLFACGPNLSSHDRVKKAELEKTFGRAYTFQFETGIYINAKSRSDAEPSKDEAIRMARLFWFEHDSQARHDSNYVYLNVYNNRGTFSFQVAWDPKTKDFIFSNAEHY